MVHQEEIRREVQTAGLRLDNMIEVEGPGDVSGGIESFAGTNP